MPVGAKRSYRRAATPFLHGAFYNNSRRRGLLLQIAICDDEKFMRDALYSIRAATCLPRREDAHILLFADGESLCRSCEEGTPFDLILLDIKMDGIDGMAAAKRIRACNSKA